MDETGANLGVFGLSRALKMAYDKDLDLIEISPDADPPIGKIMSYDKFRYQQKKEEKKQKKTHQVRELKRVRITPRAAKHDLELKLKKVDEFLGKGHRVEVNLFLRGREKGNKDWGRQKLMEFIAMVETPHQIAVSPKYAGRGFVVQLAKK